MTSVRRLWVIEIANRRRRVVGMVEGGGTLCASRVGLKVRHKKMMVGMRTAAQDVSARIQAQDERGREGRRACGWHKEGRTRSPLWRFQKS